MKKLLMTIVLALAGVISASAITPFLEFQPIQVGDGFTAFNFQAGITEKVHKNIRLGAGIGITEKWNFASALLIPIFLRGQLEGRLASLNPFFSFDVGYEINTGHTKWGAVLVNPMVGLNFGRWNVAIGYLGHCWTPDGAGTTSCFNMKIGYYF